MIITTIEEQRRIGRAARAAGGYIALARKIAEKQRKTKVLNREDYRLEQTCGACPEQYDVWLDGERVGYLRLRHGSFRADYTGRGNDETVYTASPDGDGIFEDHERNRYLNAAVAAIDHRHHNPPVPDEPLRDEEPRGWS